MSAPPITRPAAAAPMGGPPMIPGAPRVPQVNLLPLEIRASRSLRRLKRLLVLVIVFVLALAGLGYTYAAMQVDAAQEELAAEQAETARIAAAQEQYAEVPLVLGQLDDAREARRLGTSTEVLWDEYLTQLFATLPAGVAFESIQLSGATPMVPAQLPLNPLQEATPATITFTGRSPLVPDTAAWIEAIETIPNLTDAYVTTIAITEEDQDGVKSVYYEVTGTVQVTDGALALRYVEQED